MHVVDGANVRTVSNDIRRRGTYEHAPGRDRAVKALIDKAEHQICAEYLKTHLSGSMYRTAQSNPY